MTAKADGILLVDHAPDRRPIPLDRTPLTIGKSPSSDVVVDDPFVSRQHLEITVVDGQYFIRDLGSKNGIFIDCERLEADVPRLLIQGSRTALAEDQVVYRFRSGDQTATRGRGTPQAVPQLRVDQAARDVWIKEQMLEPSLSKKQFDFLALLNRHHSEAVARDAIAPSVTTTPW